LHVTEMLRELARERKHTVLVVTHDSRIFHLADRMVYIEDGRMVESPPNSQPQSHRRSPTGVTHDAEQSS